MSSQAVVPGGGAADYNPSPSTASTAVRTSVCMQWSQRNMSEAKLDALVALGATGVRMDLPRSETEPTLGSYTWTQALAFKARLDARGLAWLPILAYGYPPYTAAANGVPLPPTTGPQVAGFAAWAAAAATALSLDRVQVYNEEDGGLTGLGFWPSGSSAAVRAAEYVALVSATAAAVRAARPSCQIVMGGMTETALTSGWFDSFMALGGRSHVDVLAFHAYPGLALPAERAGGIARAFRAAAIARPGPRRPWRCSETGSKTEWVLPSIETRAWSTGAPNLILSSADVQAGNGWSTVPLVGGSALSVATAASPVAGALARRVVPLTPSTQVFWAYGNGSALALQTYHSAGVWLRADRPCEMELGITPGVTQIVSVGRAWRRFVATIKTGGAAPLKEFFLTTAGGDVPGWIEMCAPSLTVSTATDADYLQAQKDELAPFAARLVEILRRDGVFDVDVFAAWDNPTIGNDGGTYGILADETGAEKRTSTPIAALVAPRPGFSVKIA